jgi:hypothetical protein
MKCDPALPVESYEDAGFATHPEVAAEGWLLLRFGKDLHGVKHTFPPERVFFAWWISIEQVAEPGLSENGTDLRVSHALFDTLAVSERDSTLVGQARERDGQPTECG